MAWLWDVDETSSSSQSAQLHNTTVPDAPDSVSSSTYVAPKSSVHIDPHHSTERCAREDIHHPQHHQISATNDEPDENIVQTKQFLSSTDDHTEGLPPDLYNLNQNMPSSEAVHNSSHTRCHHLHGNLLDSPYVSSNAQHNKRSWSIASAYMEMEQEKCHTQKCYKSLASTSLPQDSSHLNTAAATQVLGNYFPTTSS